MALTTFFHDWINEHLNAILSDYSVENLNVNTALMIITPSESGYLFRGVIAWLFGRFYCFRIQFFGSQRHFYQQAQVNEVFV